MTNKVIYVTMFTTSTCPNCIPMKKTLESMREEYGQQIDIKIREIDTNPANMDLARQWNITAAPTCLFIENGEYLGRLVGNAPVAKLRETIDRCLQPELFQEQSGESADTGGSVLCDTSEQEDSVERSS